MIISGSPKNKYYHPQSMDFNVFLDGIKLTSCLEFDTDNNRVTCLRIKKGTDTTIVINPETNKAYVDIIYGKVEITTPDNFLDEYLVEYDSDYNFDYSELFDFK